MTVLIILYQYLYFLMTDVQFSVELPWKIVFIQNVTYSVQWDYRTSVQSSLSVRLSHW